MKKQLICIACPMGCHLEIDIDDDYKVTGNKCKKGIEYGKKELINPTRIITSTVVIKGGIYKRLPVKTDGEISKKLIFEVMKELLNTPVIFDGRNLYPLELMQEKGFHYESIGRSIIKEA